MLKEKILVVDDEEGIRNALTGILKDEGFSVDTAISGEQCLKLVNKKKYDIILLDVWLPKIDGIQTLDKIKQENIESTVIMISGHGTIETAVKATKLGAYDFIEKPLSMEKTLLAIKNALHQRRLEEENRLLRSEIGEKYRMIGNSSPMQKLRGQVSLAAPSNGRVLIYGENGTGKELVARSIHKASLRNEKPFVEVNCAAIPEELIESELFGHIKGAFTGATEDKTGKFELANGATLFLDEIGDMSLKTQSKVLRALEEQRIERVGGNHSIEVDVRVIAATNKNLEEEIKKGSFRDDLYFRLNVIPITVPPLRERKEDIPDLASYFLNSFSHEYGKREKKINNEALSVLMSYNWPGNVRELKNIIERLVIMVPSNNISKKDIETILQGKEIKQEDLYMNFNSLKNAKEHFEKKYILRKIKENNYNISETARELKIERSHLHRKLKSFGVNISEEKNISLQK
jgi:two-component system nitrogen regulation response regulator NtrX